MTAEGWLPWFFGVVPTEEKGAETGMDETCILQLYVIWAYTITIANIWYGYSIAMLQSVYNIGSYFPYGEKVKIPGYSNHVINIITIL